MEELREELDFDKIREVRIFSREPSAKDERDFRRFQSELDRLGIHTEWRRDSRKAFHDRFIASDEACYNVPPVNLVFSQNAPYSQITPALDSPPFEEWWSEGEPL